MVTKFGQYLLSCHQNMSSLNMLHWTTLLGASTLQGSYLKQSVSFNRKHGRWHFSYLRVLWDSICCSIFSSGNLAVLALGLQIDQICICWTILLCYLSPLKLTILQASVPLLYFRILVKKVSCLRNDPCKVEWLM